MTTKKSKPVFTEISRNETRLDYRDIKFIPENERRSAARYFTLSNVAMLDWIKDNDLEYGYINANDAVMNECGASLNAEFQDWLKSIEKGDAYCFDEWQEVRTKYIKEPVTNEQ